MLHEALMDSRKSLELENIAGYNCAYTVVDPKRS